MPDIIVDDFDSPQPEPQVLTVGWADLDIDTVIGFAQAGDESADAWLDQHAKDHGLVASVTFDWDEDQHPRGPGGKFETTDDTKAGQDRSPRAGADPKQASILRDAVLAEAVSRAREAGGGRYEGNLGPSTKAAVVADISARMSDVSGRDCAASLSQSALATLMDRDAPDNLGGKAQWLDERLKEGSGWQVKEVQQGQGRTLVWTGPGVQPTTDGWVAASSKEADGMLREQAVNVLVAAWAGSSNDSNEMSLAIQDVAQKEFGLTNTMAWDRGPFARDIQTGVDARVAEYGHVYGSFLHAQYDSTQAFLKEKGITEVGLYRGMLLHGEPPTGQQAVPEMRPLSSWSSDRSIAADFGTANRSSSDIKGTVLAATFPSSAVISTPVTGVGCLSESEFVVLAPPGGTVEYSSPRPDGPGYVADPAAGWPALDASAATIEFYSEDQPRGPDGRFGGDGESKATSGLTARAGADGQAAFKIQNDLGNRAIEITKAAVADPYAPRMGTAQACKDAVTHDLAARMSDVSGRAAIATLPETSIPGATGVTGMPGNEALQVLDGRMQEGSGWFAKIGSDGSIGWNQAPAGMSAPAGEGWVPGNSKQVDDALRLQGANNLVGNWASTSNDNNVQALALQEVAQREFGLTNTKDWSSTRVTPDDIAANIKEHGDVYSSFLHAQYDSTQAWLASKGITEVPAYRGMLIRDTMPLPGTNPMPEMRPMSSWSTDLSIATQFAGTRGGAYVLAATFPASAVLSTPVTGVGCFHESEFVMLAPSGGEVEYSV